jgi:hypothetical protein
MAPDRAPLLLLLLLCAWLPSACFGLSLHALPARGCSRAPGGFAQRAGHVSLLEAYELLPVMECLKLNTMDQVQACMDVVEPWLRVGDGGDVTVSQGAINGFTGGTFGVIGTLAFTQLKKGQVKDRLKCLYCDGTGQITCGHCLGTGKITYMNDANELVTEPCTNCDASGTVVCINCQGSGLTVPDDFLQVLGDEEMGFTEDDYIGLFDETPPTLPELDVASGERKPEAAAVGGGGTGSSAKGSSVTKSEPEPVDYTGGLG